MLSLVIFQVGNLQCALPVGRVKEIVPARRCTRIPGAGSDIEGLMNVRGRLLTVADGRRVLDQGGAEPPHDPSILVLEVGGHPLGLVVDQVLDLAQVADDVIEPRGALPGVDPRVVEAVVRWEDSVVVMLDTAVLLAPVFGG